MAAKEHDQSVIDCERQVIGALCGGLVGNGKAVDALKGYPWREPLHQVLFDLLTEMGTAAPERVREQLPARLTRRGFPDFDLSESFRSQTLTRDEIDRLVRLLLDPR